MENMSRRSKNKREKNKRLRLLKISVLFPLSPLFSTRETRHRYSGYRIALSSELFLNLRPIFAQQMNLSQRYIFPDQRQGTRDF